MFKKGAQISNGGSTTTTNKSNILSQPLATYLVELKTINFNWYASHNSCSQADLKEILFTYFRTISFIFKWLETMLFLLSKIEGRSQQEVMRLENCLSFPNHPPYNFSESSPGDRVNTLMLTLKAAYDRYVFAFCDRLSKVKRTSVLNFSTKPLSQKVRYWHLTLEYLFIPKAKSHLVDLPTIAEQEQVVTEIATDSVSVPLITTSNPTYEL